VSAALLERARAAAAAVSDPEIPGLSIADLGVLRDVVVEDGVVEVRITPTYSGCPAMEVIADDVRAALARDGIEAARVRLVLAPAWSSDWITPAGRAHLAALGIAPPGRVGDAAALVCPRCGARETEMISAFGSTACKSLHRCLSCREPFDAFKCH